MGHKPTRTAPRNSVVRHATVLRKGGAHGKSRKAERQDRRMQLQREIRRERESPFSFACRYSPASKINTRELFVSVTINFSLTRRTPIG